MNEALAAAMSRTLLPAGFTRLGPNWFREHEETILIVNLQKSHWGEQYYVNLAVWLKTLGETRVPPKENQCDVRIRLTSLADERLSRALNLEDQETAAEGADIVEMCLRELGIPFLEACSSLEGIGGAYASGSLAGALVHRQVKEIAAKR